MVRSRGAGSCISNHGSPLSSSSFGLWGRVHLLSRVPLAMARYRFLESRMGGPEDEVLLSSSFSKAWNAIHQLERYHRLRLKDLRMDKSLSCSLPIVEVPQAVPLRLPFPTQGLSTLLWPFASTGMDAERILPSRARRSSSILSAGYQTLFYPIQMPLCPGSPPARR